MHHIYHTDALVLSFENAGEADRTYLLYTKDLGFIYAKAQGVRLEKSKLRFALQPYALARVSLVRGKAIWRTTTATPVGFFFEPKAPQYIFETFQNITGLLKDLVPVEIPDARIFEDLRNAFLRIGTPGTSKELILLIELALMLRVLHYLGYIPKEDAYKDILQTDFSFHRFLYERLNKKELTQTINRALAETGR
jgi:recombinational DNA repair protein (RecF pathway)